MQIQNEYISGGINPIYKGMVWNSEYMAYACSTQIYIVDFNKKKVMLSLNEHKKRIQSIISFTQNDKNYLLSICAGGQMILWISEQNCFQDWKVQTKIQVSKDPLQRISHISLKDKILISLCDMNGNIFFYNFQQNLILLDQIRFGNNVQQIQSFLQISENQILIAFGGIDTNIHLYEFDFNHYKNLDQNAFVSDQCVQQESIQNDTKLKYLISLKGHSNVIMGIEFQKADDFYFLASCSQDATIRLWKIQLYNKQDTFEDKNKIIFEINQTKYQIHLESILLAHQEAITFINWGLINQEKGNTEKNLVLISSSLDHNIILWANQNNIWMNINRFGQISGNKNCFYSAIFSPNFQYILGYTLIGSFYLWKKTQENTWIEDYFLSGHFRAINDIDWSSNNKLILTGSQDQTTRIFGQCKENWNEISRPQIHGYDINSVKFLRISDNISDMIVSAGDEKIVRLFEPSAEFVNLSNNLCGTSLHLYFNNQEEENEYLIKNQNGIIQYKTQTEGGQQVLGLMVKAVKVEKEKYTDYHENEQDEFPQDFNYNYQNPPIEDYIQRKTLWVELNKLYGHGYELQCITTNNKGSLIVSSCKSQSQKYSQIYVWCPKNYQILQKISGHNYTVTQMQFSPCDNYLCSVSRDRQVCLFKYINNEFKLLWSNKDHSRIVWSISFSHDSKYFVTSSRDKKIRVFQLQGCILKFAQIFKQVLYNIFHIINFKDENTKMISEFIFNCPVTALDFADKLRDEQYIISTGLDNGQIHIMEFNQKDLRKIGTVEKNVGHSLTINRIKFQKNEKQFVFASCSDDHSLRIYKF